MLTKSLRHLIVYWQGSALGGDSKCVWLANMHRTLKFVQHRLALTQKCYYCFSSLSFNLNPIKPIQDIYIHYKPL